MNQSEKRHKASTRSSSKKSCIQHQVHHVALTMDNLPLEVLEMIFKFLPYREIAGTVRLVNKKCSSVATMTLNSAFFSAGKRLSTAMRRLEIATERATDECELMMHGKAHNYLEFVKLQYELLRAVVWRYTHPPRKQKFDRLCFYGGAILDDFDEILRTAVKCPGQLLDKVGPASSIINFGSMCKKFMNYFEKVSERKVNSKSTFVSGCKPVDILDCLLDGRELLKFKFTPGRGKRQSTVSMSLRYVLKRAWFTCLDVPGPEDENSWRDQQRFMYLRLRRLVGSVNEHLLDQMHYEREKLMRSTDLLPVPTPPSISIYSGYGDYGGKFYYYGNMNKYAYENKIMDVWRRDSARNRMRSKAPEEKPSYDLVIDVKLKCSPELAPLSVRSLLKCDHFENTLITNDQKPELYLKLNIFCPASVSNKLPGNFVWEVRSSQR